MSTATIAVPNAIVFVLDPSNRAAIVPEYGAGEIARFTSSCVSVATLPDVDGEVTVLLSEGGSDRLHEDLTLVCDTEIATPGNALAIVTSENVRVLEKTVRGAQTRVRILVDDLEFPSVIRVVAQ